MIAEDASFDIKDEEQKEVDSLFSALLGSGCFTITAGFLLHADLPGWLSILQIIRILLAVSIQEARDSGCSFSKPPSFLLSPTYFSICFVNLLFTRGSLLHLWTKRSLYIVAPPQFWFWWWYFCNLLMIFIHWKTFIWCDQNARVCVCVCIKWEIIF